MRKNRKSSLCSNGVLRIIDVNLNRAREGLRVCEDVMRFICNDTEATRQLKYLKHKINNIVATSEISYSALYKYRDVKTDVGRELSLLERKNDCQTIFLANFQRVKESLRVLEEFFKLFDNTTGERYKSLRFKLYDAEKKIVARSKVLSHCKYKPNPRSIG